MLLTLMGIQSAGIKKRIVCVKWGVCAGEG